MIGIINYGSGNIYAISNIYKKLDIAHDIISDVEQLKKCDKLILPGVGAFDETMNLIKDQKKMDVINDLVLNQKIPVLGVCVGMQIIGESSDEGNELGFGWIKGRIRKINKTNLVQKPHLPHLGWNSIKPNADHALLKNIDTEIGFYFLHNYYFDATMPQDIVATVHYGDEFPCVVNKENIYGVQFHPEKSHENGLQLFKNYATI